MAWDQYVPQASRSNTVNGESSKILSRPGSDLRIRIDYQCLLIISLICSEHLEYWVVKIVEGFFVCGFI